MSAALADDHSGDPDLRRSELERAVLSVQRERVALTESFMRLRVEGEAAVVEALIVRLLRLQRAVVIARDRVLAFK